MRIPSDRTSHRPNSDLIGIIEQVRRRWRMKLALRARRRSRR